LESSLNPQDQKYPDQPTHPDKKTPLPTKPDRPSQNPNSEDPTLLEQPGAVSHFSESPRNSRWLTAKKLKIYMFLTI
jgi:hypothetical protein